jgi:hypothetical protein
MEHMEIENNACHYVLECMDTFKDHLSLQIQDFLTREIFPITLEQYSVLCRLLVCKPFLTISMMVIHMAGEELKKRLPDHVSEIEQERVKYLKLIYRPFTE